MNKKAENMIKIILGIVVVCLIGMLVYSSASKSMRKQSFEDMLVRIRTEIPSLIPYKFKEEELVKDVSCRMTSNMSFNSSRDWYEWNQDCTTTIYVDDKFDEWDEREQYKYLSLMHSKVWRIIEDTIIENFPEYELFSDKEYLQDEVYGEYVTISINREIIVVTSANTYEYSGIVDDYFVKNNADVYVREEGYSRINCEVDGCTKAGLYEVVGFSGATEYYCYTHYNEIQNMIDNMLNEPMYGDCDNCGRPAEYKWDENTVYCEACFESLLEYIYNN